MRLIDTHVHFWDLRRDDLRYSWLDPGRAHPILGEIDMIKAPLYDGAAFVAESRFCGVEKIVHVEAAAEAANPGVESAFVREAAAGGGVPCALVVHLELAAGRIADDVAIYASAPDVSGVRDFGVVDYLDDPGRGAAFDRGLSALAQAGLVLDLDCDYQHMAKARATVERHPSLPVVLEHVGYPRSRDDSYFAAWASALREIAAAGNVHCKLSGLGMTDRRWSVASLRRWVDTCLEAFGPSRCLFGSNWPIDRIASSYDAMAAAFAELIAGCTAAEQAAICSENAERLYFADGRRLARGPDLDSGRQGEGREAGTG